MQPNRYIVYCLTLVGFIFSSISTFAQLGISFDIPKPKQYEERTLRSEKSESKKLSAPGRFIQNTTTHYNYFFNAHNKLNEVIAKAKEMHRDDYTELLSFYNYDLDETQRDSLELDSVIYKSMSGIALHDLRSNWADNMYLLWGAAYYLKKEFDSAYLTFQFINYAFAPKEKDGYYQYIGSNLDGNNAMSISSKEKTSITSKMLTRPPSRNDAFIWQIRTFLAQNEFAEAASLIAMLKADPVFPKRLQSDLNEVEAYYYYKQNMWDSSAFHLSEALDNATNKHEKGRWEFLIAQMYELSQNYDLAQQFYEKSIGHTLDPELEVYARLYSIRTDKTGGENFIDKNIAELLKMAKRDKYSEYRDIIYYMAAEMELDRHNPDAAREFLKKAAQYDHGNVSQRNRTYLQLGELAFANKDYRQAKNSYDSVNFNDPFLKDTATLLHRKEILGMLAEQAEIVIRQDSLQKIANMPEDQRKEFVRQVLKQLRKAEGMKEEGLTSGGGFSATTGPDLFSQPQSTKGEWYFYNTAARVRGNVDFRTRWGNRPNVDNWRRMSAVAGQVRQNGKLVSNQKDSTILKNMVGNQSDELSFDALYAKLPLTPEQLAISNDSIQDALYQLGKIFLNELDDCAAMTRMYEELTKRFTSYSKMDEVIFRLYYCYNRNGESAKAAQLKSILDSKYQNSKFTKMASGVNVSSADNATKTYENIYNLFVEGNFDEALAQKKVADSVYGANYWTPQLLYIEAVYYIRQRQDSTAITSLRSISVLYPKHPLAEKAKTMINVLRNRNKIEEELSNMVVEDHRPEFNKPVDTTSMKQSIIKTDSSAVKKSEQPKADQVKIAAPVKVDSIAKRPTVSGFSFNTDEPHSALVILTKVDGVYANEAKNAFDRYCRGRGVSATILNLDAANKLVVIKPFSNLLQAGDFALQLKKIAGSQIIPWLTADKYSFSIISDSNLEVLKSNPDLAAYKRFLDQNLPGKF